MQVSLSVKEGLSCFILRRMENENSDQGLAERIRYLREDVLGMKSQKEFAEAIGGVSRGAVGNWELGKGVKAANLIRIADRFGISFQWLVTGYGERPERLKNGEVTAPTDKPSGQAVLRIWALIPDDKQDQALRVLSTFAEPEPANQPPPPAPQPPPAAPSNRVTPRFKEQPELPTIGQGGTVRYYLLDWMDHRNMEPEDLVKRLPDWELEDLKRVLAGRFEPPDDLIYYAAKALRTTEEKLQELPPTAPPKPAKAGKKTAKR